MTFVTKPLFIRRPARYEILIESSLNKNVLEVHVLELIYTVQHILPKIPRENFGHD